MQTTRIKYTEQTNIGLLSIEQVDNGMYNAEIKDNQNNISATVTNTLNEVYKWLHDQTKN